jgi:hypothetical protein
MILAQLGDDVVQPRTVSGTIKFAGWFENVTLAIWGLNHSRLQVYYACAVGGNEWNFNPPVVDIGFLEPIREVWI